MGLLAVTAGSSKLVSGWRRPVQWNRPGGAVPANSASGWELAWAGLILLIGVQLLFYSE
jgi:hypothetical protein